MKGVHPGVRLVRSAMAKLCRIERIETIDILRHALPPQLRLSTLALARARIGPLPIKVLAFHFHLPTRSLLRTDHRSLPL